jgi:hypothetical protein
VSGVALDYFANTELAGTALSIADTASSTQSNENGEYSFDAVAPGSALAILATRANYLATRNEPFSVEDSDVQVDSFIVAQADASRQYSSLGMTSDAGAGMVIVTLVTDSGLPDQGVSTADITLVGAAYSGPFFFGPSGDVVDQGIMLVSAAFEGRARAAFLNVSPGTHTLNVAGETAEVVASAGTVTLVRR